MAKTASEWAEAASLLDYTPPSVEWQAPLVQQAQDPWVNYVQTSKSVTPTSANFGTNDLIRDYNIRLSYGEDDPRGLTYDESGRPESMSDYGKRHWDEFGSAEGRTRGYTPGTLWTDPNRSYYMGYTGSGPEEWGGSGSSSNGDAPKGMEMAYPVWSYYGDYDDSQQYDTNEYYHAGAAYNPHKLYYTQETDMPYFQYAPGDPSAFYQGNQQIRVGQAYVPTGDYSGIFSF